MSTSSARYTDLYDYCRAAEHIDHELIGQADRLANRLSHFEATCRESGFRTGSDSLGPAMRSYGVGALSIDRNVRTVGERFERADAVWRPARTSWLPGWWDEIQSFFDQFGDRWSRIASLAPLPAYLVMTWRPAAGYAGKIIVSGPWLAREILGLSPHLSHIKTINLLGHAGKNVWVVGPWFLVSAIIGSAGQWMKDIKEYQNDFVRMINAITIDTEVTFATMGVAAFATLKIAGVIVAGLGISGTVGPFLVVAGVGLGIGILADKFLSEFYESDFRRDAIEWVTQREHAFVNFVYEAKDQAAGKLNDFVSFLDAQVNRFVAPPLQPLPAVGPIPVPRPTPTRTTAPLPPSPGVSPEAKSSPFAELAQQAHTIRAEDVPTTIDRRVETKQNFTPYPRGSSETSKSNCTWYAATALAAHTGNKIDLHAVHEDNRMGVAYHWPAEAREARTNENHPLHGFVAGVNKEPAAGTIITFDKNKGGAGDLGHVAWVEDAHIIQSDDGKKFWEVTLSEENYSGGGWNNATLIETGDAAVKRWRRTVTYPVNIDNASEAVTDGVEFIHWNPAYKPT